MSRLEPAFDALMHYEASGRRDGAPHEDPLAGYTRYGVAQVYWPEVVVRELTWDSALEFYRSHYWDRYGLSRLRAQRLGTMMLLSVVNMHDRDAVRALQRACRFADLAGAKRPEEDGRLGPVTIAAANALDPLKVSQALEAELVKEYALRVDEPREAHKRPFIGGWIARATLRGLPPAIWESAAALTNGYPETARTVAIAVEDGEPGSETTDEG